MSRLTLKCVFDFIGEIPVFGWGLDKEGVHCELTQAIRQ
jgi:hypothetical protein